MDEMPIEDLPSLECLFESNVDTICPFGDIVLAANDDFLLPTAKFQVSSCILAMSSKVFTTLFSKTFLEGQSMCSRKPGELLEIHTTDAPSAMKHFLRLLHHADPLEPDEKILSTNAMLDLAIIIDKYDCTEALRLPASALLVKYLDDDSFKLDHLTTAAFMLDQPEHFRRFTKDLVSTKIMIQAKNFDRKCLDLLPSSLLHSLFCQQSIIRQELTTHITCFIEKFTKACKIASRENLVIALLEELAKQGLWPITFDTTVQSICSGIGSVSIPTISVEDCVETTVRDSWGKRSDSVSQVGPVSTRGWGDASIVSSKRNSSHYITTSNDIDAPVYHDLKQIVESVQQLAVGVCLDCISGKECRKPHR